jgi:membrane protein YdbS with pleckstrin-like domain
MTDTDNNENEESVMKNVTPEQSEAVAADLEALRRRRAARNLPPAPVAQPDKFPLWAALVILPILLVVVGVGALSFWWLLNDWWWSLDGGARKVIMILGVGLVFYGAYVVDKFIRMMRRENRKVANDARESNGG